MEGLSLKESKQQDYNIHLAVQNKYSSCAKQPFKVVLKLPLMQEHYCEMQEQR